MQHCQFFHKSKIKKGKFTHLGGSSVNDLERRNSLYFAFSTNLIALLASYVTVVEDIPIMSAKTCLCIPVFLFWPKLTHLAVQSLCDSWATCMSFYSPGNTLLQNFCWSFHRVLS